MSLRFAEACLRHRTLQLGTFMEIQPLLTTLLLH